MKKKTVAILGSTSHIAKGLINNFLESQEFSLHLYTRSSDKVLNFLKTIKKSPGKDCVIYEGYRDFRKSFCDVVINCVGVGTANKLQGDYPKWFTVTEEYDNLVIGFLRDYCPNALYISFSSGVIYGKDYSAPKNKDSINQLRVNQITSEDYYAIARLNAEAKHRAFNSLKIVDLRLFSYFSRFIDLTDGYFITELLNSVLKKKVFITNGLNIVRDYIHPEDLFLIIQKCITAGRINAAFDVTSAKPVEKREILDYFSLEYGLKYKVSQSLSHASATGPKNIYCSKYNKALEIGYKPKFSSLETIKQESKYILNAGYNL